MPGTRKSYAPSLKAKVAMEAIKAQRTTTEIAKIYSVHPNPIGIWKKQAVENLPEIFNGGRDGRQAELSADKDELYRQIGVLKVELEFLKKKSGLLGGG